MNFDDELLRALKQKGGRYNADYEQLNTRVQADLKQALKVICVKEGFNMGNVMDYLIEGFIANYRELFPADGQYQTQLTSQFDYEVEIDERPEPVGSPDRFGNIRRSAREVWLDARVLKKRGEDVTDHIGHLEDCLGKAVEAPMLQEQIEGWIQEIERM